MPDGHSLCFAVRENPFAGAAASSSHVIPGIASPVVPDTLTAVSHPESDSHPQPENTAASS